MLTDSARRRLDDIEKRLLELNQGRLLKLYERLLGRPAEDGASDDANEGALVRAPDYGALLEDAPDGTLAPLETRRLDIHRRRQLEAIVRTDPEVAALVRSLHGRILDFRPFLADAPAAWVDIREALRTEPDEARREALWFAATPLAESIESDVQQLFAHRNRVAHELDFSGYPELAMAAGEVTVIEYLGLCDEIEGATRDSYETALDWIRERTGRSSIEPWDIDYHLATLDSSPADCPAASFGPRLDELLASWGLSRAGLPITVIDALLPYGGLTLPVSIPDDIRVIVQPRDGQAHFESWCHEMGHALHMAHVRVDSTVFQWDAPAWEEAMAFLLERAAATAAIAVDAPPQARWRTIVRLRRLLAASLFEILAYERPEGDLHSLYSEIHESYLGYPRHPERLWSAMPLSVTHPVYLPNYVLGRLVAAQLEELRDEAGSWGRRLRDDLWAPGAVRPWTERVEALTGRPLDPDAFLRGLGISVG